MKLIKLLIYSSLFICFTLETKAQNIWTKTDTNIFELNTAVLNDTLTTLSKEDNTSITIQFTDEKGNLTL